MREDVGTDELSDKYAGCDCAVRTHRQICSTMHTHDINNNTLMATKVVPHYAQACDVITDIVVHIS